MIIMLSVAGVVDPIEFVSKVEPLMHDDCLARRADQIGPSD